ncbi:MAG: two-component system sensor histidine kinase RppB [Oculatellaceae cyanobacterium bins.114]|nr:two-component system sensor histidine kinase RppB [Oculatellaceae cyanobacterium bins.114]
MQTQLFRRTRLQLAGWYAVIMGLTLSLGALTLYQIIIRAYSDAIDRELESVAETLHNGIEWNLHQPGQIEPIIQKLVPDVCSVSAPCPSEPMYIHDHLPETKHRLFEAVHKTNYYIQFLNSSNKLIATAGLRSTVPLTKGTEVWATVVDSDGNRFHQISYPLHTLDNQLWGYLQVGRSLEDLDSRLASLKLAFLIGLPIITTIVAVSSWVLAGIAMRPIYRSYQQMQRFTTDAAHELRTPLAAILATVESVSRLPNLPENEARDTLKTIERQVSRFFELVKDLFLLARLEQHTLPVHRESVCLNDLMNDLVEEFSALADANSLTLAAEIQISKSLPVLVDEDQIYRLISNLVVNSIHYTPAGGIVTLILKQDETYAVIQVHDTGMGIPLEEQTHIFDRFYRVNRDRSRQTGGSGLGLAIAKAIAETHNGSLHVQSEVGQGSTFTVRLPLKSSSVGSSITTF